MFKKLTFLLVLLMLIFSAMPVFAAADYHQTDTNNPVIYKSIINVTQNGGVYRVGFAEIRFPKDFIDADNLPVELNVEISAVNGVAGIEFSPDIPSFDKNVTILVHTYDGLLYDKTLNRNIQVHIRNQKLTVHHFSRYAFS
jgi:hypothetical protein